MERAADIILEIIQRKGTQWCLFSKKKSPKTGKRRNLGCYGSRQGAVNREKEVQAFKHKG